MKLLSAAILAVVVALFGLWWAFVRAPAPQRVCDHMVDVVIGEAEADGMSAQSQALVIEQMTQQCVKRARDKIQLRGRLKYATYARCVVSQHTLTEIERC